MIRPPQLSAPSLVTGQIDEWGTTRFDYVIFLCSVIHGMSENSLPYACNNMLYIGPHFSYYKLTGYTLNK
jgi:hypothetical protein